MRPPDPCSLPPLPSESPSRWPWRPPRRDRGDRVLRLTARSATSTQFIPCPSCVLDSQPDGAHIGGTQIDAGDLYNSAGRKVGHYALQSVGVTPFTAARSRRTRTQRDSRHRHRPDRRHRNRGATPRPRHCRHHRGHGAVPLRTRRDPLHRQPRRLHHARHHPQRLNHTTATRQQPTPDPKGPVNPDEPTPQVGHCRHRHRPAPLLSDGHLQLSARHRESRLRRPDHRVPRHRHHRAQDDRT